MYAPPGVKTSKDFPNGYGFVKVQVPQKSPEDDEIGWKDTVKMNPLEDIIVAMQPAQPQVPFGLDRSIRADDPSQPLGVNMGFTQFSTNGISGNLWRKATRNHRFV